MASVIGRLNVLLSASANGFTSSLGAAGKALTAFGGKVKGFATSWAGIVSALAGGAAIAGVAALTKASLNSIDTLKDEAESLGVTTAALSELQYAASFAGVESSAFNATLGKMLNNLNDAAQGSGTAAKTLEALGLNAAELATMAPDAAFRKIADAIAAVENPAQKVAYAMDIFGKSGRSLIPILNQGSQGLAAQAEEARKLGVSISGVDAAQVEAANDGLTRVSAAITGIGNRLAVTLAPFVEDAAKRFVSLASSGEGMGARIMSAFESVVKGIAYAADYLYILKSGFKFLQSGAAFAIGGILKAIDWLGAGVVKLLNLLPGVELQWTDTFATMGDALIDEGKKLAEEGGEAFKQFSEGSASKAVGKYFDEVRSNAQQAAAAVAETNNQLGTTVKQVEENAKKIEQINKTLEGLRLEVAQSGMSDTEKQIDNLKRLGATDEQLAEARGLLEQQEKLKAATKATEDLDDAAKKLKESLATPAEKAQSELDQLIKLYESGRITAEEFAAAQKKIAAEVNASTKVEPQAPKLLTNNSEEGIRLRREIAGRSSSKDSGKQQVIEQKKSNGYLAKIAEKIDKGGVTYFTADF